MTHEHRHAENMKLYAQDAAETCRPWERWEYKPSDDRPWTGCDAHPNWYTHVGYRRKAQSQTRTVSTAGWNLTHTVTIDGVRDEIRIDSPDNSHCIVRKVDGAPGHYPPNMFYDLCADIIDHKSPKPCPTSWVWDHDVVKRVHEVAASYAAKYNQQPDSVIIGMNLAARHGIPPNSEIAGMKVYVSATDVDGWWVCHAGVKL